MVRSIALFVAWLGIGFLASWLLLYGFTPVGPPILLIVWLTCRYMPRVSGTRTPEAYGALGGFGLFCLVLASSIDGDAAPISALGAAVIGLSVAVYVDAGRRRCSRNLAA
jgi:hypothetical protein